MTDYSTHKRAFFTGAWRDAPPTNYKPIDEVAIAREQRHRRQVHEASRSIPPVCIVCGRYVPARHPDYLVTDSMTSQKSVAHVECCEVADAPGWKLRHCVGGLEVEEDD